MGTFRPVIAAIAVFLSGALLPGIAAAKSSRHAHSHAAAHSHGGAQRTAPPISADTVNNAQFSPSLNLDKASALIVKAEILLDRQSISPGQIDGRDGDNARKAIAAFQESHGLDATGKLDEATWNELAQNVSDPPIVEYQISDKDVKGPFAESIPHDLVEMARLEHLSYTSPLELLGEKFHVDPKLLTQLNPGKRFEEAGATIFVPNVGERDRSVRVAQVEVDKWNHAVRALGENGELVAFYPASIGSQEKPAPSGKFKVRRVSRNPTYHYDPKFHFKGVHTNRKLTVAAGPNNPVGLVWIDLSIESYGIHGTPDPERVGKTYSHGCIRLTNWDALDLAGRIARGTPVAFLDEPPSQTPTKEEGPGEARGRE